MPDLNYGDLTIEVGTRYILFRIDSPRLCNKRAHELKKRNHYPKIRFSITLQERHPNEINLTYQEYCNQTVPVRPEPIQLDMDLDDPRLDDPLTPEEEAFFDPDFDRRVYLKVMENIRGTKSTDSTVHLIEDLENSASYNSRLELFQVVPHNGLKTATKQPKT